MSYLCAMKISAKILKKKAFYTLLLEMTAFVLFIWLIFALFSKENRMMFSNYFNKDCKNYVQVSYSRKLNDRLVDYVAESRRSGITECADEKEIMKKVSRGDLIKVRSNGNYLVDDLTHSYPYLTDQTKDLLTEIGKRYQEKISEAGLKGSKFIITSLTRTAENKKLLRRKNGNLSDNSPHVNGNAFDISYARFDVNKLHVTECDKWFMKEALGEVLYKLKQEKRCWVTYERSQGCFHVVARDIGRLAN